LVLFTGVIFSYYLGIVICVIGAFNIMLWILWLYCCCIFTGKLTMLLLWSK
jgi:hypothetical protein